MDLPSKFEMTIYIRRFNGILRGFGWKLFVLEYYNIVCRICHRFSVFVRLCVSVPCCVSHTVLFVTPSLYSVPCPIREKMCQHQKKE